MRNNDGMVPIAVVVILVVIVFTVAVVLAPDPATLSIFGAQINTNTAGVYFTGAVTMLVLLLALMLFRAGLSRMARQRKEIRSLKEKAEVGPGTPKQKKSGAPAEPKQKKSAGTKNRSTAATGKPATSEPRSSESAGTAPAEPESTESPTTSADRQSLLDETDAVLGDEDRR